MKILEQIKKSAVYAVSEVLFKGINFLLLPIYTFWLTPAEFGIIGIANTVVFLTPMLFSLGIRAAAMKFYFDYPNDERRKEFYGTIWIFSIVVPAVCFGLIELTSEQLANKIFSEIEYDPYVRIMLATGFFGAAFFQVPREFFRAADKPWAYTLLNSSLFLSIGILTYWYLVVGRQGVFGALMARLVAYFAVGVIVSFFFLRHVRFRFRISDIKAALLFSLPLIPHFLSFWVLTAANRMILERYDGLDAVGVFSLAFSVGTVVVLVGAAQSNALIPTLGAVDLSKPKSLRSARSAITQFLLIVPAVAITALFFVGDVISMFVGPEYYAALGYLPVLLIGFLLNSLYYAPVNVITLVLGKPRIIGYASISAAIVNIIGNLLLVPWIGIWGSVVVHVGTYGLLFVVLLLIANESVPGLFDWPLLKIPFAATVCCWVFYYIVGTIEPGFIPIVLKTLGIIVVVTMLARTYGKVYRHTALEKNL